MIWHDDDLDTFMDLIKLVISRLTPLQKATFTRSDLLNKLVEQARQLIPESFRITRPLGTLSQLDLQCSPALREVLKARNLKVIRKTYPVDDWTGEKASYLRVVDINDPENEEEPLKSAGFAQEKQKERKVRMQELENSLHVLWKTTNRLT